MRRTRPNTPNPSARHVVLIDELGGPTIVAALVSASIGLSPELKPQAVSMWRRRGIPYRYRAPLAILAREKCVNVPPGFLGESVPTCVAAD